MFSPLIISSNRSQKLEAVSRAKGELTVTWLPWKLKCCQALSRVTWQGLENVSLRFQLISPAPVSLQERYQGTQRARLSHGPSTVGWGGSICVAGWWVKTHRCLQHPHERQTSRVTRACRGEARRKQQAFPGVQEFVEGTAASAQPIQQCCKEARSSLGAPRLQLPRKPPQMLLYPDSCPDFNLKV